jgi:hypothetical protein
MRQKLKLLLLGIALVVAVAGAVHSYVRAQGMEAAIQAAGYVPWPAGPDDDLDYFWKVVPGQYFDLVGADQPDVGGGVMVVGFALWMGLLGFLTRGTLIPYIVSVASLVFSILCTGGFSGNGPVGPGLVFDAGRKVLVNIYGKTEPLCSVAKFSEEVRNAAKGGPSYWVVAHFKDGRAEDLTVFDTESLAVYLLGQIEQVQANAGCSGK